MRKMKGRKEENQGTQICPVDHLDTETRHRSKKREEF